MPDRSGVEILQDLIALAKEVQSARSRDEETGSSRDAVALHGALVDNESAVEVLGDDLLRLIAQELLQSRKANMTVDWAHRYSARARLRC